MQSRHQAERLVLPTSILFVFFFSPNPDINNNNKHKLRQSYSYTKQDSAKIKSHLSVQRGKERLKECDISLVC